MEQKKNRPKIIAFYLPQYHTIPENDIWWGKGFTEWTNIKRAKPLFEGHSQPRIPLDQNYYDLSDENVMRWQADLAKEYGIYGFCIYHYWFGGKLLLEKPVENLLAAKDITISFCLCWANENWTNQWVSDNSKTLISQNYGNETEWKKHYDYLSKFFKDDRYIKKDGKPILVIYRPDLIDHLNEMIDKLNEFAKQDGFIGLCVMCQRSDNYINGHSMALDKFDYFIEYQPAYAIEATGKDSIRFYPLRKIKRQILFSVEKIFRIPTSTWKLSKLVSSTHTFDYDTIWEYIINMEPITNKSIPGAFVNWDNTPRKGIRGTITKGFTVQKFEDYLTRQIYHANSVYQQDMLFLFAWNEWTEGGYVEPDEENKYAVLEAIRNSLKNSEIMNYERV